MVARGATEEICHPGNFPLVLENLKWVPVWEKKYLADFVFHDILPLCHRDK